MFDPSTWGRLTEVKDQTDFLNTCTGLWTALKKADKARAEIDLMGQINAIQWQLAKSQVLPMSNMPHLTYNIPWDSLPSWLVENVRKVSSATGWDGQSVLMAMLVAISMASWGRYTVRVNQYWSEPINLYSLVIAPSGTRKSALVEILKQPFVEFIGNIRQEYDRLSPRQDFIAKEQLRALKKVRQDESNRILVREAKKGGSCDYDTIVHLVKEEAVRAYDVVEQIEAMSCPARPSPFLSDSTSKGLLVALQDQGECQAIFEPEGGLIEKLTNDSRFDIDLLIKAHGREEHDSKMYHRVIILNHPSLNILYGVQPEVAAKFYRKKTMNERGLTARFLPLFVRSQNPGAACDDLESYKRVINDILADCYTQDSRREFRILEVSTEAQNIIVDFMHKNETLIQGGFDHMASFLSKLHGTACRLAGVLHLLINEKRSEQVQISPLTMRLGIELASALLPHADYAYNPFGLTAFDNALTILDWTLKTYRTFFELRHLMQSRRINKELAERAVGLLAHHNVLREIENDNGAIYCVVNPNIYPVHLRPPSLPLYPAASYWNSGL